LSVLGWLSNDHFVLTVLRKKLLYSEHSFDTTNINFMWALLKTRHTLSRSMNILILGTLIL